MSIAERRDPQQVVYPESDGQPMADNTLQFEWIATIKGGLDDVFHDAREVFVAGDLLWYPVEGEPTVRCAPDVLVVFGRPKGHRGSYLQWKEANIAPQVVFEIVSPGNRFYEMLRKFRFYEEYGVEEYYLFNPDRNELEGWRRFGGKLEEIPDVNGWVSPLLGVRFEMSAQGLCIYGPTGQRFQTYEELAKDRNAERERADRLAARLRELGIDPE